MSIVIMILLLSMLILVHEAGHFFVAKMFGMKVERFGFGLPIGPTLYETKWGDVKILVHACLLGGYISFPDDEKDCDLPADSEDRFVNKPIYQRMAVVSAGVLANILIAFVLVIFTALVWKQLPTGNYDIKIADIVAPEDEAIWNSGLQKGDKIVSINGTPINNSYTLLTIVKLSRNKDGYVSAEDVDRNYELLKALNPAFLKDEEIIKDTVIRLPEKNNEKPIILDKYMAKGAKLYKNDQYRISEDIVRLRDEIGRSTYYVSDGKHTLADLAEALSDSVHPINMVVEREDRLYEIDSLYPTSTGALGIKIDQNKTIKRINSLPQAVKESCKYLYENTELMVYGLGQIFTGNIPLKELHGIIAVTKVGGDVISHNGIFYGILLAAIISIDLAIINFLPIPALDGGHFLFLIIEKIRRKPLPEKVTEYIANACFIFLILLTILVLCNDIFALVTQKL
ncbi:site-2 protease family protein [bacterium]|nr:site-2 protease family protein [bacterium]